MLSKLKSLGPGLLYAGAAVGVSHLVQSTRAGAQYGYILIIAIILAHILKYPFFVLGPRYAKQHNQSLVNGFAAGNPVECPLPVGGMSVDVGEYESGDRIPNLFGAHSFQKRTGKMEFHARRMICPMHFPAKEAGVKENVLEGS